MSGRDRGLAVAVILLAVFGAAVQIRLRGVLPEERSFLPLLVGLVGAVTAAAVCTGSRVQALLRGRWVWFGLAAALMAALLVFGRRYRGGLYLPGRLNPSELVKLCLVFWSAGVLSEENADGRTFKDVKGFALFAGGVGLIALEVAAAGDFGLLAQLVLTLAAMLFAASWFWGAAAFATVACGAVCAVLHPMGHLATRVRLWRDPFADVTGSGWQTLQGVAAVVHGGVSGSGFGMGDAQNIPIVSSDFVYAALAEDLGLVGCAAVLACYAFIFVRGLIAAGRAAADGDRGTASLATGIVASVSVQVILNVAGVLNALPMTGITLPLISHGGSSLVVTLILLGALAGLSRRGARK